MQPDDILVIGAGPAGLATSACLRHAGLLHVVLEREAQIASAWHRHYDRLHLHTTKTHSALPYVPWPQAAPRYPSREQVLQYLQEYAARHQVAPRLGVTVRALRRRAERFEVDTSAGVMTPRMVVMATGANSVPNLPSIRGLDCFGGSVVHAGVYRNPTPYQGKRTLVIGCGNSGAEIALDLAEQGVDVAMVVRGPVHVVPRDMLGRPIQHTNILLSHLPLGLRDAIALCTLRVMVGDLSRWGIKRPAVGPNRLIQESGRIPLLDVGTIAMVKHGRIRVLPAVQEVLPDRVRFANGADHPFEAIILATGYTSSLNELVEGFATLVDAHGRPSPIGSEGGLPGLYFVGFSNPATGVLREIAREAPRVVRAMRAAGRAGPGST